MSAMAQGIAAQSRLSVINPLAAGVRAELAAPPLCVIPAIREGRPALLRALVEQSSARWPKTARCGLSPEPFAGAGRRAAKDGLFA